MEPDKEESIVKDAADSVIAALILENYQLKQQNQQLQQMIPLLKNRLDSLLVWFQQTVNGMH